MLMGLIILGLLVVLAVIGTTGVGAIDSRDTRFGITARSGCFADYAARPAHDEMTGRYLA